MDDQVRTRQLMEQLGRSMQISELLIRRFAEGLRLRGFEYEAAVLLDDWDDAQRRLETALSSDMAAGDLCHLVYDTLRLLRDTVTVVNNDLTYLSLELHHLTGPRPL